MRFLRLPANLWRWFWHEQPWKWRPGVRMHRLQYDWRFGPVLWFDWTNDGFMDFNAFGMTLWFGGYGPTLLVHDND